MIVVILTGSPPHRILLLRRGPSKRSIWQPVTGRAETGERIERAARREVEEETGIRYGKWLDLGWRNIYRTSEAAFQEYGFAVAVPQPLVPKLSEEHVAWRWVTARDADRLLRWKENRQAVQVALRRLSDSGDRRSPG